MLGWAQSIKMQLVERNPCLHLHSYACVCELIPSNDSWTLKKMIKKNVISAKVYTFVWWLTPLPHSKKSPGFKSSYWLMLFCVGSARFSLGFNDMNVCVAVFGLKQTGDLSIVYSAYCTVAFGSFSSNNILMIHF